MESQVVNKVLGKIEVCTHLGTMSPHDAVTNELAVNMSKWNTRSAQTFNLCKEMK